MKKRSRRRRFIPADELSRDFMLPVRDGYGILEQAIRAVKPAILLLFCCLWLPRKQLTNQNGILYIIRTKEDDSR